MESLQDQLKACEAQLASIREQISNEDKLNLQVTAAGWLGIFYGNRKDDNCIGTIGPEGRCHILNTDGKITAYEKWRKSGMKIDKTEVSWRGKDYRLLPSGELASGPRGFIYDFKECRAETGCEDENIVRFKHNKRPILY